MPARKSTSCGSASPKAMSAGDARWPRRACRAAVVQPPDEARDLAVGGQRVGQPGRGRASARSSAWSSTTAGQRAHRVAEAVPQPLRARTRTPPRAPAPRRSARRAPWPRSARARPSAPAADMPHEQQDDRCRADDHHPLQARAGRPASRRPARRRPRCRCSATVATTAANSEVVPGRAASPRSIESMTARGRRAAKHTVTIATKSTDVDERQPQHRAQAVRRRCPRTLAHDHEDDRGAGDQRPPPPRPRPRPRTPRGSAETATPPNAMTIR